MTFSEKKALCIDYFNNLYEKLCLTHELVISCNDDISMYLVPKGTKNQITYSSKPVDSYRVSDHWNWFANLKKCPYEKYVQCFNVDLPKAKPRTEEGKASKPVYGIQVAYFGKDQKYHHVFGEKFDRTNGKWVFE